MLNKKSRMGIYRKLQGYLISRFNKYPRNPRNFLSLKLICPTVVRCIIRNHMYVCLHPLAIERTLVAKMHTFFCGTYFSYQQCYKCPLLVNVFAQTPALNVCFILLPPADFLLLLTTKHIASN